MKTYLYDNAIEKILNAMGLTGDEKIAYSVSQSYGIDADFTDSDKITDFDDFGWLAGETDVPEGFFDKEYGKLEYTCGFEDDKHVFCFWGDSATALVNDCVVMEAEVTTLRRFLENSCDFDWDRFEHLEWIANDEGKKISLPCIVSCMNWDLL